MRRFRLCLAFGLILTVLGCGKGGGAMTGKDPIDEDDTSTLSTINQYQLDSLAGLNRSLGATSVMAAEDKVQKMADLINDGSCTREYVAPLFRFDRGWIGSANVIGDSKCPVNARRRWSFDNNSELLQFSDSFTNQNSEYRKWDQVAAKTYTGELRVTRQSDSTVKINGVMNLHLVINGFGDVTAEVLTAQQYHGSTGSGALKMTMIVANQEKYVAEMNWNGNMLPVYKINTHESDRKTFDQLFSAVHLNDMLDWSGQMR